VISEYNAYWHQGKIPDYQFNAKEMDEESGMYYYSARYYAPPVFISRDPLFEKKPWVSAYAYCSNSPVMRVDPSGMSDWEPDENGNLIAEQGDNAQTLSTFLGISQTNAQQMINSQNLATETNNGSVSVKAGETLTLDNVFTRSINNSTSDLTTDVVIAGTSQTGPTPEDYYNCWGSAISGSQGQEIQVGVGISSSNTFDAKLASDYTPTTEANAQFGKTVLRFADGGNNTQHGAVFYGKSQDGTTYVYTKNGWYVKPQVMKLSDLQIKISSYGTVQGINPSHSGYYQPK
jgi:RHS repeat-associated protein